MKIVKKIEDQKDFNASALSPGGWCCSCCCWCWATINFGGSQAEFAAEIAQP